jgi:hypothetical protein
MKRFEGLDVDAVGDIAGKQALEIVVLHSLDRRPEPAIADILDCGLGTDLADSSRSSSRSFPDHDSGLVYGLGQVEVAEFNVLPGAYFSWEGVFVQRQLQVGPAFLLPLTSTFI